MTWQFRLLSTSAPFPKEKLLRTRANQAVPVHFAVYPLVPGDDSGRAQHGFPARKPVSWPPIVIDYSALLAYSRHRIDRARAMGNTAGRVLPSGSSPSARQIRPPAACRNRRCHARCACVPPAGSDENHCGQAICRRAGLRRALRSARAAAPVRNCGRSPGARAAINRTSQGSCGSSPQNADPDQYSARSCFCCCMKCRPAHRASAFIRMDERAPPACQSAATAFSVSRSSASSRFSAFHSIAMRTRLKPLG